jgi:hypothetical protein
MLRDHWLEIFADEPRWVDIRGVLLEGPEFHGEDSGCIAVRRGGRLLVAMGSPERTAFESALAAAHPEADLLATGEAVAACRRYLAIEGERALIHALGVDGLTAREEGPEAVLTDSGVDLAGFSEDLRWEVKQVSDRWPIAVVLDEGAVTSVCFPALITESFWDVSINTAEDFRRRGRAVAAFRRLEREMRQGGRQAVWGALETNIASLALAARLGFDRVGEVVVFDLGRVRR